MKDSVSRLADQLFAAAQGKCEHGKPAMPSFLYKGAAFDPGKWQRNIGQLEENDAFEKFVVTYDSPDRLLRLKISFTVYSEYPVVEWLPELVALGKSDTGIVENFRSLNLDLSLPSLGEWKYYPMRKVTVRRYFGSKNRLDDFVLQPVEMTERYPVNTLTLDTDEGRSSAAWLPFVGVDLDEDYGFNIGIGWSGEWSANFALDYSSFKVDIGMKHTHFRLRAGETIRQPSIFVMLRDGFSVRDAQNLHRRFILDFHSPRDSAGKLLGVPLAAAVWGGQPNEVVLGYLDKMKERGIKYDVLWMDAGWFGEDREVANTEYCKESDWARTVGNWRVNQVPHPGGLSPISEKAHKLGMKFLLWVEIERVKPGSPVALEHPDWIMTVPNSSSDNMLLNFGLPEVREWAVATVSRLVKEEGIDYYRQDFNFNTIPFWNAADADDRQGISEAKFIAGFYEFWDTLRRLFPDMLIDNCASGGRRIDFETMSRSICLWRSDVIGRPWFDSGHTQQSQMHYLAQWVPMFAGSCAITDGDEYGCLCAASPGVSFGCGYDPEKQDKDWEQSMVNIYKRMQKLFYGDFYPLIDHPEDSSKWTGYQMHDPESGNGFVAAFRHPKSQGDYVSLALNEIQPRVKYRVEDSFGNVKEMKGVDLVNMFVELPKPRSAYVAFYTRVRKPVQKKVSE